MQRGEPCLLGTFIHRTNFNFVKDLAKVSPWHPKAPCRQQGMTRLSFVCELWHGWCELMHESWQDYSITSCVGFFLAHEHTVQSARFFQAPVWQPCTTQDISFGSLLDPRARPWGISFGIWWNNLRWGELWKMVALNMGPWKNERSLRTLPGMEIHDFQVSCQTFRGNQGATGVGVLLQFEVVCWHTKLPCCGLLVENPPYLDGAESIHTEFISAHGVHQWFAMTVNDCHDARIESPKSFVAKTVSHPWSLTPPKGPNLKQCQVSLAQYFQGPSALKASHLCLSRIVPALASPEL